MKDFKMKNLIQYTFLTIGLLFTTISASDQPQWGQQYSRNMVSGEVGLPTHFDPATGENIKWKIPLGTQTYSTPVVSNGKIFIGTNNDNPRDLRHKGDRGILYCLNEKDGSLCWQLVVPKLDYDIYWDWPGEGIVSPATVEKEKVYLVSNRGEVLCLDLNGFANGNDGPFKDEARHMAPPESDPVILGSTDADIIWLYDMVHTLGIRQHDAAHSSILLHGDLLYVNTSNGLDAKHQTILKPDAPSLIVLNKNTGRMVARDNEQIGPNIFHSTWSSPALGHVKGNPLIFFCGGDGICYAFQALNPNTKAENPKHLNKIWWFDGDPNAPKENVQEYVGNRQESPSNIKSMPVFHNNQIYLTLGGDIWWGKRQAWLKCIDATQTGDITGTGERWSYPLEKHVCATPSIYNGIVFVGDLGETIHCLDANTGKPYWTQKTGGEIWASTLVADDKVYVGTRRGDFWILAAKKEKKIIHNVKFDSPIHSTATAANGVLYVATMKYLYAIEK
jgi:outer membrane protein assembly factor BamB